MLQTTSLESTKITFLLTKPEELKFLFRKSIISCYQENQFASTISIANKLLNKTKLVKLYTEFLDTKSCGFYLEA